MYYNRQPQSQEDDAKAPRARLDAEKETRTRSLKRRWEMTTATSGPGETRSAVFLAPPKKSSGCRLRGCVPGRWQRRQARRSAERNSGCYGSASGQPCGKASAARARSLAAGPAAAGPPPQLPRAAAAAAISVAASL